MKCVALLSSGIDSPVACYTLSPYVDSFVFVHADNRPYTDDREILNTIKIAQKLDDLIDSQIKMYLISHGDMLKIIQESIEPRFTCVLCKRMMVRYAKKISEIEDADALIMGDSLGQVASQTLQNLIVVDRAIDIPILRPLIGWDKEEIIDLAKQIGTFNLSILPSVTCKAVPSKPATKAKLNKIEEIESHFSYKRVLDDLIKHSKVISINEFNSFIDL